MTAMEGIRERSRHHHRIFTGKSDDIASLLALPNMDAHKLWNLTSHSKQSMIKEVGKVEKILKGSLDSIPSPSASVKIQIMGGKVCLRCKGKTLLGVVNKLLKTKCLLTSPSNALPYYLK